jgi:hypothetical protein
LHPVQVGIEPVEIRRQRRMRLFSLTLMATIGFLMLGQSRAHATCGDYLSHHTMVAGEQSVVIVGADSMSLFPQSRGTPESGTCRGPFCKQGPMQSPLSTPIVSADPQDRWVWTAEVLVEVTGETSFLTHYRERVELPSTAFRLERPPKV